MKLVNVTYLEECTKCVFFNVTLKVYPIFGKPFDYTRRAYLNKWVTNNGLSNSYNWADNGSNGDLNDAVVSEMVLKYQQQNK